MRPFHAGSTNSSTVAVVLAQAETPLADDLPTVPEAALLMLTDAPTISQEQWRSALENGARAVLRLPAESDSLLTHLARAARPRRRSLLLGVVGAMLGGWLGGLIFNVNLQGFFNLATWLLAIGGSVLVLLVYGLIAGRRAKK